MQLSDVEVRILGCLIEKEATTPDNYPLSLNALTNACNQLSNREPVMSLSEDQVKWAVNNLRQQSLVRAITPSDARVMKFQHLLTEKLDLDQPARAVLCVLMLRGPQTLGEIKTRTNRLAEFASLADVEAAVSELITRELAVEMARRAGQKETRYAHLLSGPPTDVPTEAPVAIAAAEPRRDRVAELEASLDELRRELAELRARFEEFTRQFS
ncbi:MAG TPA: YceH family protein [Gemmatimonadaceae bacterium]|nr:YceH family protein [Gemmatimonadaceae bacterium]